MYDIENKGDTMTLDEYIFEYMAQLELYWTGKDKDLSMTFHDFCKEEYKNKTFLKGKRA